MLESVFADVMKKVLQPRDLDNASSAKSVQRVVREGPFAAVAAHNFRNIVGRESCKSHLTRLHATDASSAGVFFSNRAGDDLLEVHADLLKTMFGQVAAMEADGFIGIVAVIVVPIEQ